MKTLPTIDTLIKEFRKDNGTAPTYLFVGENEFFDLPDYSCIANVYCGMQIFRVCAKNHLEVGADLKLNFPSAVYVGGNSLIRLFPHLLELGGATSIPLLAIPIYLCVEDDVLLAVRTVH